MLTCQYAPCSASTPYPTTVTAWSICLLIRPSAHIFGVIKQFSGLPPPPSTVPLQARTWLVALSRSPKTWLLIPIQMGPL